MLRTFQVSGPPGFAGAGRFRFQVITGRIAFLHPLETWNIRPDGVGSDLKLETTVAEYTDTTAVPKHYITNGVVTLP
jgi:hypothetical protein